MLFGGDWKKAELSLLDHYHTGLELSCGQLTDSAQILSLWLAYKLSINKTCAVCSHRSSILSKVISWIWSYSQITQINMEPTTKTAVTVLQELMVKLGRTPEYECLSQSGPKHQSTFEYRCSCCDVTVTASARSKKDAKQEVARLMLQQLALRGHSVPPPYSLATHLHTQCPMETGEGGTCDPRSYVALLKELCEEYKLPAAEFELVGDTGPPHLRHFTVRARVGQLDRCATATAKKTARQLAAQQLYSYLRENLATLTADFVEETALVRALDKAKERYMEVEKDAPWRPDLAQKISEYHLGIGAQTEESGRVAAEAALRSARDSSPERALQAAAAALGLQLEYCELEPLSVVQLTPASPPLAFAAEHRDGAAHAALRYLRAALHLARTNTDPAGDALSSDTSTHIQCF